MAGRVRVFIATSLDGFIAGPNDDLSWLPQPTGDPPPDYGYKAFIAEVGALLMGRNTYDVVAGFSGPWLYGELPMLVATGRPLTPVHPSVRAVSGAIGPLIEQARATAGEADVYLDGGNLIRQALDAGLVDELIVSVVPVILGAGAPLFAGVERRQPLTLESSAVLEDGLVQLRYRPLAQL
ncbi:dihydrofolate reductase family protein [Enhygromyxa salina]|uniref:Dihydrofolate reductase n=1 Tax=Enhygromyxa salina TaxID=215803 RepID=A0A2S9YFD9_9BACT|nr:dihydrofolate reductase family protein [Enhygromyxa salina]PRQ03823.1 Dihydrofolate reductase [Enhygromyxa salina]